MFELHRIEPVGTPNLYRTFQVAAPLSTHFRPAKSCEEVDCANYLHGWITTVNPHTVEGQFHMETIKQHSVRFKYTIEKLEDGRIQYIFPPGQDCFELSRHRVRIERPERHFVRSGDYRNLGHPRELSAENWQEEFEENQDNLKTIIEKVGG